MGGRRLRRLLSAAFALSAFANPGGATGAFQEQVGEPWVGAPPVQETVDRIMARAAPLPPAPTVLKPVLRRTGAAVNFGGAAPVAPSTSTPAGPLSPQTVDTSIAGPRFSDSGFAPPDSMGAAGISQILFCENGVIRVTTKAGVTGSLNTTTNNFFKTVTTAGTSDPKVKYDRVTQRWFVVMIDVANKSNQILIAVSDGVSPDITGSTVWTFFAFKQDAVGAKPNVDTGRFADFPTLGIDKNALYIGCNMFSSGTGTYASSTIWVVQKSSVLGAGPPTVTPFRGLNSGGLAPYTPWGVDNDDPGATDGYFICADGTSFTNLDLIRVSTPGGTPTIAITSVTIPLTATPLDVPAQGSNFPLASNQDTRPLCGMIRGTSLWTAHHTGVNSAGTSAGTPDRTGTRWYEIINLTGSPSLAQSGTLFDPSPASPNSYWMPSLAVSGQNHMALGSSVAGPNRHAEVAVTGRLSGDPGGTLQSVTTAQTSSTAYNLENPPAGGVGYQRWGDYSCTCVDPADNMTMWTFQEYCDATNSWRVQGIRLLAPPPATPNSASPPSVSAGLTAPAVVNIVGTSASGSGFYDPGTGFTNRLAATISNNPNPVTVTYTDPTHISLSFVTTGATAGPSTITITNPDGQFVVFTGGFSITSATGTPTVTGVTSTVPDGAYGPAASIPVVVTFSEAVNVTGTPLITLALGGGSPNASYAGGSGTPNLTFSYTVVPGDNSPDLDYASATALQLNGGTIKSAGTTNNAVLTLAAPGTPGSLAANKNIVIDTTPPDTSVVTGPPSPTNQTSATFTFSSTKGGSTFEVQLDGGGFVANGSSTTVTYPGPLAAGTHHFQVRATDSLGNVDPTPADYNGGAGWVIDLTPPDTVIDTQPSNPSFDFQPTFTYHSTKAGSTFEYQVDGGAWTSTGTTGSAMLTLTTAGSHTFTVRATDPAGNVDPSPASYTWTVDFPPSGKKKKKCGATGLEWVPLVGLLALVRRRSR